MNKRSFLVFSALSFFLVLFVTMPAAVSAQSLLPDQIGDIFNLLGPEGSGSANFVTSRVQLGLVLALGAVVLIAVVYAIMAAIKYIQSQGDAGKIEEAQKAIQAIFFGIGAMLIAIVGIVLVFVFFGANRPDPALYQVCLSAPNSAGCESCLNNDAATDADGTYSNTLCGQCEAAYDCLARNGSNCDSEASGTTIPDECDEP
ncbi:MAG: hypothetical protein TR69_WS6001000807 [candidate division WS6 bacterium OLB20]|uniref:Uncharacterized protein n=1 Tax=candidate division WS6 bacterium OLB20 TaxID=1617426 RepID=A0A136LYV1_9BACT|nr:MAG: hypothetical protein TR69_WS6001000807 [candidate division WS6 bacterium OLB20]